jgi:starch synthase
VNPLDEEEIAKAILKILGNKKMAKKFGRNGKKRVKNVYNWDNSARIISKMLAKFLKKI